MRHSFIISDAAFETFLSILGEADILRRRFIEMAKVQARNAVFRPKLWDEENTYYGLTAMDGLTSADPTPLGPYRRETVEALEFLLSLHLELCELRLAPHAEPWITSAAAFSFVLLATLRIGRSNVWPATDAPSLGVFRSAEQKAAAAFFLASTSRINLGSTAETIKFKLGRMLATGADELCPSVISVDTPIQELYARFCWLKASEILAGFK